jgi:hypothetical protein
MRYRLKNFTCHQETLYIFVRAMTMSHFRTRQAYKGTLASLPPNEFSRPPRCYYRLQNIKNYDLEVASNGTESIPNFVRIGQLTSKLK